MSPCGDLSGHAHSEFAADSQLGRFVKFGNREGLFPFRVIFLFCAL